MNFKLDECCDKHINNLNSMDPIPSSPTNCISCSKEISYDVIKIDGKHYSNENIYTGIMDEFKYKESYAILSPTYTLDNS